MKYIILETRTGLEYPIIFPDFVEHSSVVPEFRKVVSAGKVGFGADYKTIVATCSGESISLGVKSRGEEDNILIERMIESY